MQKVHIAASNRPVTLLSLDAAMSVGYRVNSARGTQFRRKRGRGPRDRLPSPGSESLPCPAGAPIIET